MEYFKNETFDIVRSDITMQHVDLEKALNEIKRVLKKGGLFLSLEGAVSKTFAQDPKIMEIYDRVLPENKDGGPAIKMNFILPEI